MAQAERKAYSLLRVMLPQGALSVHLWRIDTGGLEVGGQRYDRLDYIEQKETGA